jgi:hypothetical protein
MITLKDAVKAAQELAEELYGELAEILVEEVESKEKTWIVTLSFLTEAKTNGPLAAFSNRYTKWYKRFEVDAVTGTVLSMKIRNPQEA